MRESIGPWGDFSGVTTPGLEAVIPIPATVLTDEDRARADATPPRLRPAGSADRRTCGCTP
ncbi:hypothetical protein GCM10009780_27300 [Actinomadura alba]